MRKIKVLVSIILILVLQLNVVISQSNSIQDISDDQLAKIDKIVESLIEVANLPGVSIAIKKDENIVFAKAYGYSDIELNRPMTVQTRLRTASVAKVMTVTALGKLVSEGRLDLDAPISNYVEGLREDYKKITSRQLAGHLSGLKHRPQKKVKDKLYKTINESIDLFKEAKLEHVPGTKYKYSTNGYTLLSGVIEGASGMTFLKYMDEEIFRPLGMINSRPEIKSEVDDHDASLYFQKGAKLKKEKKWSNPSVKWAGAGFRTTPSDLVLMMEAYTNGMIKEEVVQDLFQTLKLKDGTETMVGVGWRTDMDPFGKEWRDHAGNWQGARTVLAFSPEEKLSISIMVNCRWNGFIEETAHVIAAILKNPTTQQSPISLKKDISALFVNHQGEEFTYMGTLSLDDGIGELRSNSKGFLRQMPLFYLGNEHHYAAITPYGVMYMRLNPEVPHEAGKLFMYSSMRRENPTVGKASVILSFRDE